MTSEYDRYIIIADPTYMDEEQLDEAYNKAEKELRTVTPSWQDAVPYAKDRPDEWGSNTIYAGMMPQEDRQKYKDWVARRDPATMLLFEGDGDIDEGEVQDIMDMLFVNPSSPYWPYKKRKMEGGKVADAVWVVVHHTAGPRLSGNEAISHIQNIARMHCSSPRNYPGIAYTLMIDGVGNIYKVNNFDTISYAHGVRNTGRDENKLGIAVCLLGDFTQYEPNKAQMEALDKAIDIIDNVTVNDLEVIGHKDLIATACPGSNWPWRTGWGNEPTPAPPQSDMMVGLHDIPGGEWLANRGLKGCCLALAQVQLGGRKLDLSHLSNNNVLPIVRVDWGYADGTGSLPRPENVSAWIEAVVYTINNSMGVAGWIIGNEINNPTEWPGGYPHPNYVITIDYYIDIYNRIASRVSAPLAPFSIDPFNVVAGEFGLPADPKVWAERTYNGISRYDFVALHAKTQTNDPAECWSKVEFSHAPLLGRKLHLRTIEDQLQWIPNKRAIYITELNPQRKSDGSLGWDYGNGQWIKEACSYVRTQPVSGVMFYRYELAGGGQEGFALVDKPVILQAIRDEAR